MRNEDGKLSKKLRPPTGLSDPGRKPELKWLSLDKLYVDASYQRSTNSKASQKNLDYIQANFHWSHCGALIVSFVASAQKYAVIDGQHRLDAARRRGDIPELPCIVISNLDVKKQAKSFQVVNSKRVILNSLAAFHAAVAAEEEKAVAVKAALDECGITVPTTPVASGDTGPRETQAVGTIAKLLASFDPAHVKWALTVIADAYGQKRGKLRAQLIRAVTEFHISNPTVDDERMRAVLCEINPKQLEADTRSYVVIEGGSTKAAAVKVLERQYRAAARKAVA